MNILTEFRDNVKNPDNQTKERLLQLTDELRDELLPQLGIGIEDRGGA